MTHAVPFVPAGFQARRSHLIGRNARVVLTAAVLGTLVGCAPLATLHAPGTDRPAVTTSYTPSRGQPGKDVVWIPTPDRLVTRMLQLAQVTPADYVVDLGSGDGKIVIAAVNEFNARGLGLEYNPDMVRLSQGNAERAGIADRARFRRADIFETDFSDATVVTMYLLPHLNLRLRQTLMAMQPGTRLVSHQWTMGHWPPDETTWVRASPVYSWIVPANAGGTWQLAYPQASTTVKTALTLTQRFQRVTDGGVDIDGMKNTLRSARIDGDRIRFAFTDGAGALREFDGRISGDAIGGSVTEPGGKAASFSAVRTGPAPPIGGSQGFSDEESMQVATEAGG